ncbi:hypothetical protein HMPREF1556_00825, partial [Porphyromonas sp. oral taxon 278 str. W7784]
NKFPHMRKYFSVYTEINFLICGNFTPSQTRWECGFCGRVFLCPKKGALTGEGMEPIYGVTGAFAPRKKKGECLGEEKLCAPLYLEG